MRLKSSGFLIVILPSCTFAGGLLLGYFRASPSYLPDAHRVTEPVTPRHDVNVNLRSSKTCSTLSNPSEAGRHTSARGEDSAPVPALGDTPLEQERAKISRWIEEQGGKAAFVGPETDLERNELLRCVSSAAGFIERFVALQRLSVVLRTSKRSYDPEVLRLMQSVARSDRSPSLRASALDTLSCLCDDQGWELIKGAAIRDADDQVRSSAALLLSQTALGEGGYTKNYRDLTPPEVDVSAIPIIVQSRKAEALQILQSLSRDGNPDIAAAAKNYVFRIRRSSE